MSPQHDLGVRCSHSSAVRVDDVATVVVTRGAPLLGACPPPPPPLLRRPCHDLSHALARPRAPPVLLAEA